jgi:N-acetylglucosaminyl-diphospho-decaprenol L-rhamnosyltransferase
MNGSSSAAGADRDPAAWGKLVTVVVVSHNSAEPIATLAAALEQSNILPKRWLVVDNDSNDDTAERAKAAGFEVHQLDENVGFGAACNVGLSAAETEFVLFCNPDIVPGREAIDRLITALLDAPSGAMVGPALGEPVEARHFSRLSGNLWQFLPRFAKRRVRRYGPTHPVRADKFAEPVDFVEGAFILCRVNALRSVDGFDERFFLYSEEEDLARRLRQRGWQTLIVPSATVTHGGSKSSKDVDRSTMAAFRLHSLYWYYRRYHPRWYAECARVTLAVCVVIDRAYRAVRHERQLYSASSALAGFRSISAIRFDYERRRQIRTAS